MPHIDYPNVITESPKLLHELEKRHRYTHLFQRVRMLRLLKSGQCTDLGGAADALGYSRRQCQRWWGAYTEGGLDEMLVSRVDERGRQEFVTEEAWEELEGVMKEGGLPPTLRQGIFWPSEVSSTPVPTAWVGFSGGAR